MPTRCAALLLFAFFTVLTVQTNNAFQSLVAFDALSGASKAQRGVECGTKVQPPLTMSRLRQRKNPEEVRLSKERLARSMIPAFGGALPQTRFFVVVPEAIAIAPPSIYLSAGTRPPSLSA